MPSSLAQGLRGALFVVIFRQFFSTLPWELDDSARIDGLGGFGIFTRIMLPLSRSAVLVVFLFSLVWHWNDHFFPAIYLQPQDAPLSVRLASLWTEVRKAFVIKGKLVSARRRAPTRTSTRSPRATRASGMAACMLVIVVPLVLYAFLQRFFTESIERTGLVE